MGKEQAEFEQMKADGIALKKKNQELEKEVKKLRADLDYEGRTLEAVTLLAQKKKKKKKIILLWRIYQYYVVLKSSILISDFFFVSLYDWYSTFNNFGGEYFFFFFLEYSASLFLFSLTISDLCSKIWINF